MLTGPSKSSLRGREACVEAQVVTYSPKVFIPLAPKVCRRDVCHYCTFAGGWPGAASVPTSTRRGARHRRAPAVLGGTEALFMLGDKAELRYKVAREELAALGCETTIEYLTRMCAARPRGDGPSRTPTRA